MSVHWVDRSRSNLTYTMRLASAELIARCAERRVPIIVLETLRSSERQDWLFDNGKSWTRIGLHEPSPVDGKSRAMDAAPIKVYSEDDVKAIEWNASHRNWGIYVEEAVRLGLECGAFWRIADWSHVQLPVKRD